MVKIIDGNGTGKTKKLMEIASDSNGVFVCRDVIEYTEKAGAYGITGLEIISYNDYFNRRFSQEKPVFINKIDNYLMYVGEVAGFSLTV